jgi:enoyl-CoA hydratase/carnithine racemase
VTHVRLEVDNGVAALTLARPEALNALNSEMVSELGSSLRGIAGRPDVRAVVVAGAGRAFSAGADLRERSRLPQGEWPQQHLLFEEAATALQALPQPAIAAVSGWALGGGLEIALGCDFVVAHPGARFGQPEVQRGLIPGMGGTQLLPRRVPSGVAAYMLLTGCAIDCQTAHRCGLVALISEAPLERALELAGRIAANSPAAVRALKEVLRLTRDLPLEAGFRVEREAWRRVASCGDAVEGARAFAEGRPPKY